MLQINERSLNVRGRSHQNRTDSKSELTLENLAAVLAEAIYPIALRHEGKDSWVELELALWRELTETLNGRATAQLCAAKGE